VTPEDFAQQVEAFRNRQTRQRIEVKFDHAEQLLVRSRASGAETGRETLNALYESIRADLEEWRDSLPDSAPGSDRAERLGMSAASEKRIGNLFRASKEKDKARKAYEKACEFYRRALEAEPFNHWVITQYLSMSAVLAPDNIGEGLVKDYGGWWSAARQITEWDLRKAGGDKRAWALATFAELELLGSIYGGKAFKREDARNEIRRFCREMYDVVDRDTFPVFATRRQFRRYVDDWPRQEWKDLAKAALEALGDAPS
jgi:hypothetical protein